MGAGPTARPPDSCQYGWAKFGQTKKKWWKKWSKMTDGNWYEIEHHLSPFCTRCAVFLRENGPNLSQNLCRPAPNATAPCTLHPALDGPALANRLWMERLGGPNAEPVWSSVIDEPLEGKELLFSPDLWLNFIGTWQFWIIILNA